MNEVQAPWLVSLWTNMWPSKFKLLFQRRLSARCLANVQLWPKGEPHERIDKWQPEQTTTATRDPGQNTCAGHSCTPFHLLSLLSHSCCICHLSELMLRFVVTPGKEKDVALYRQWQHTSLVTCTLTGLIFLFSLSPFPAVYPNQDPELSYQREHQRNLQPCMLRHLARKRYSSGLLLQQHVKTNITSFHSVRCQKSLRD